MLEFGPEIYNSPVTLLRSLLMSATTLEVLTAVTRAGALSDCWRQLPAAAVSSVRILEWREETWLGGETMLPRSEDTNLNLSEKYLNSKFKI